MTAAHDFWGRAVKTFQTAHLILKPDPDKSASCSYYAAFYAVSALFALQGIFFTKHSAVESAVHRDLVKDGRWPVGLGEDYSLLREARAAGDYGGSLHVHEDKAAQALQAAQRIMMVVHAESPDTFPIDAGKNGV